MNSIPVSQIHPNPHQPRRGFDPDNLEELAQSIREVGLLCPVLVRPSGDGFEIVHGERRYRACQLAGLTDIPAEVRDLSDEQAFLIALTENLQREQLNPIDEANAYQRLRDDFGMTEGVIAKKIGRSQPYVADRLSLLRLSEPTQDMLIARAISPSVGRMLARLPDQDKAEGLALEVAQGNLTVRGLKQRIDGGEDGPDFHKTVIEEFPPENNPFAALEWLRQRNEFSKSMPASWTPYQCRFALNVFGLEGCRVAGQCLTIINMGTKGKPGCPDMALIGKRALWPFASGLAKALAGMEVTHDDDGRSIGVPDWKAFEVTAPKAWECLKWEDPANRPNTDGLYDAMVASQALVRMLVEGLVN